MKRRLQQIANLFRSEIQLASNVLIVGSFTFILLASKGAVVTNLSLSSLPFLRGGYVSFAPSPITPLEEKQGLQSPILSGFINLQRTIDAIGNKIQSETAKQWGELQFETAKQWSELQFETAKLWGELQSETDKWWGELQSGVATQWGELNENVGREWGKLTSSIGRLLASKNHQGMRKLDEVLRTFKLVLNGGEVDTAKLLKACRAHLILMRSGGAAMRVVAKDMEVNLNKAEAPFRRLPKQGRHLASLLEAERESGIHDGNVLKERSAAMGLLWIRRSLAFQLDLYSSLIPSNGRHPSEAAMDAYYKNLSPYHGWLLQKVFPLSLSQIPDRQVFIAKFGGREVDELDEEYEREIVKKLKTLVNIWEPIISTWRDEYERLDLEDTRLV